jgi:Fe-S-cluster containining protein
MKDNFPRRFIKRIALFAYNSELRMKRSAMRLKGEPQFELAGRCELCAQCCETPSIQVARWMVRLKTTRWLLVTWHKHVNGFDLKEVITRQGVLVFTCSHFDPETRRCDSYESRPGMCRDYPRNLLYAPMPEFLPSCGYFAVNKKRAKLEAMLADEQIDPSKKEALDEAFYLKTEPENTESNLGSDDEDLRTD